MKTPVLTLLGVMILNTSAFAIEKHSAVAPEPARKTSVSQASIPNVSHLPASLQRAVLWGFFLSSVRGDLSALDLAAGVRFVEAQMAK